MALTDELVAEEAAAYAAEEPLAAVEDEQLEGLPGAYAAGEFGWRDAEWVVRWCFRRYLGEYPDDQRRAHEDAFAENDYEAVADAIATAVEADTLEDRLAALTALSGVDVPVASAFLQFIDPERFVVLGEPEWAALADAGELERPFPDPVTPADYERYLGAVRAAADRTGHELVAVQRACWRLGRTG